MAIRYQIISLINAQLADKAKECNSNLDLQDLSKPPKSNDKVSGFLSAIITAEELLNYQAHHKKSLFLWKLDTIALIDQFYLQLHTTIREFMKKDTIIEADLKKNSQLDVFKKQFERSKEFLNFAIEKNRNGEFEKLHEYTIKRNNKWH